MLWGHMGAKLIKLILMDLGRKVDFDFKIIGELKIVIKIFSIY